jgi:hypothetical protein
MGIDVKDVLAQDPELLQRQLYQQEMQRLNPQGNAAGAIGAVLGRGLGNVTRGRGFFDVADPALQKVAKIKALQTAALEQSGGDPVKTLEALSASLIQDPELAPLAFQVQEQLLKLRPQNKLTTVAPGASVIDSQGNVVFTAPDKTSTSDQRIRETRISGLVARGMSPQFAEDIVDRNISYEVVPQTGQVRRINKLTGQVDEIPIGGLPPEDQALVAAATEQEENKTLWDAAREGTGVMSSIRSGASRVVGQIPGAPQATKTEEARQFLSTATNDLARALVINPRFPVAEVERIIKEAGTQPGAFDTPELMRSRLKVLDSFLRDRLKTAEKDANNTRLPQDTRSAQAANAAAIRSFLPKIGAPDASIGKPPKGVTTRQWQAMTPEQRKAFQ